MINLCYDGLIKFISIFSENRFTSNFINVLWISVHSVIRNVYRQVGGMVTSASFNALASIYIHSVQVLPNSIWLRSPFWRNRLGLNTFRLSHKIKKNV